MFSQAMRYTSRLLRRISAFFFLKIGDRFHSNGLCVLMTQLGKSLLYCDPARRRIDGAPLFSLVLLIRDKSEWSFSDALESVFRQSCENWELLICLSSELSVKDRLLVWFFSKWYLPMRRVLFLSDRTVVNCRNRALAMSHGRYIAFLEAADRLEPVALLRVSLLCEENSRAMIVYSDEDWESASESASRFPHFKPDWAPDTFRSFNYLSNLCLVRTEALRMMGGFCQDFEGAEQYDSLLRLTEMVQPSQIVHVPELLFHNGKKYCPNEKNLMAARCALTSHLARMGWEGRVVDGCFPGSFLIDYSLTEAPLVSIVIPNRDHVEDLKICVESIIAQTTYPRYEILIVENNSVEAQTELYYQHLLQQHGERIFVLRWEGDFNYSAVNNWAAAQARGEYLLFLNNDTSVITPDWLEKMVSFARRPDVGIVGCTLLYRDNTIQHAGFAFGIGTMGVHAYRHFPRSHEGYWGRLKLVQNLYALTGACIMVKKMVFWAVGGFDEKYVIAVSDVDLCRKFLVLGKVNVYLPHVELYHDELKTRGGYDTMEKTTQFLNECKHFWEKWGSNTADPYYNINLTNTKDDYSIRDGVIK